MHQPVIVYILQGKRGLLHIRDKLFGEGCAPASIGFAEEVEDRLGRELHYKVGLLALREVAEVVDREDIGVLEVRDTPRLLDKTGLGFIVKLIQA